MRVSSSQPTSGNWERTECSSASKLSSGHLWNPITWIHEIPKGKWPHIRCSPLGHITCRVVYRKKIQVPSSHVSEIARELRKWELLIVLFFQRTQHIYFIWKWFPGKKSYCTLPCQCQKTYHTQTLNNDFKKWLWVVHCLMQHTLQ